REPWERANIERFRRTLELLGDPDPDGVIAERLSGQTPFTSTDLLAGVPLPEPEEPEPESDGLTPELLAMLAEADGGGPPEPPAPAPKKRGKPKAHAEQESVEVDLSIDLDGIKPGGPVKASKAAPKPQEEEEEEEESYQENDIDSVFSQLRKKASKASTGDAA